MGFPLFDFAKEQAIRRDAEAARPVPAPGMVRAGGPATSELAAGRVAERRTKLHAAVLAAFAKAAAGLTDEELEELPEFDGYGPSTIRKRRSELFQWRVLRQAGTRKNRRGFEMAVWVLA